MVGKKSRERGVFARELKKGESSGGRRYKRE